MKTLSYVNGFLTVIRDGEMFRAVHEKPEFIQGHSFYYEPTLRICDGLPLTQDQESDALAFINFFEFPKREEISVKVYAHCVDEDGNYLGYIINDNNYREVIIDINDDLSNKYYDGTGFVERVLVDKATNKFVGIGDTRTAPNTYYAPDFEDYEPFSKHRYEYNKDTNSWSISLEEAKACKTFGIKEKHRIAVDKLLGDVGAFEVTSFATQEREARAWLADNTVNTPFLYRLIEGRGTGESKEDLVEKIIYKSDLYAKNYALLLGKFHKLNKLLDGCKTIDEVKLVIWEEV